MALISSSSSDFVLHPIIGRRNASAKGILAIIALLLAASASLSSAAQVYNVGDEAGWIVAANYSTWASSKTFRVGDTIVFIYNKSFHNVLEVSKEDYHSCNSSSPIAAHATGNDSIPIIRSGHRFFICGFPGHCAGGQKIDIRVPRNTPGNPPPAGTGTPSAGSPAPLDSRSAAALAPSPQPNGGNTRETTIAFGLLIAAVTAGVVALLG
ncbi:hypothetical protein KSP39_PZI012232 [Platanthera zijinensis]|uniref:Phytocyanin domain-containing protein n=1 Tax=Platanthera zijinensis TaxID=2320716 RepID=A0AAP0G531_9ASPA